MARVTVKDLRAEARRRLLDCGNGKTISRMNKKELIMFLDCIAGSKNVHVSGSVQDKARLQTVTDEQVMPGNLFAQPRRKKKRVPRKSNPIQVESDEDDEPGALGGAGLPSTYREFVKHMLPHVRAKGLAPQAAMKTVAMMWRKHKGQRGSGLTLTGNGLSLAGSQKGMGVAKDVADVAGGIGTALGAAGVATGATGIGLAATPFLEAGAAAAGTVAGAAKGIDYIESLFS
jgi:hypothetical protein